MKNAIGSELLARWRFFAFGDVLSAYEFAFGRRGFASAEATPLPQCCCLLMAQ